MIVRHNFHLIAELERGTAGLHMILILVVGLIRHRRNLHHRKEPEQVEAVNCHSRKNPVMIDRHNFRLIAESEQGTAVHRILMILVAGWIHHHRSRHRQKEPELMEETVRYRSRKAPAMIDRHNLHLIAELELTE
jgi:hypothetical protein